MRQLLSDVAVLELATDPAGSYCGKVFADLGADVVKVEAPGGDPERQHPERYQHLNTNKRAVRIARRRRRPRPAPRPRRRGRHRDREQGRRRPRALRPRPRRGARAVPRRWWSRRSAASAPPVRTPTTRGPTSSRSSRRGSRSRRAARSRSRCSTPRVAALCSVGHTAALGALAGMLRARASGAGAHVDVAAFEALGQHPDTRRVATWAGSTPSTSRSAWPTQRGRHAPPRRHLPLRRRLRVDDVDAAAARGDARRCSTTTR